MAFNDFSRVCLSLTQKASCFSGDELWRGQSPVVSAQAGPSSQQHLRRKFHHRAQAGVPACQVLPRRACHRWQVAENGPATLVQMIGVRKKSWKLNVAVGAYSPLTRGSLLDTRETQALACFTKDVCGEKQIGASTHLYLTPLFRAGSFTCTPYIYHMPHTLDVPSLDFLSFKFPFGRTAYSLGSIQCLLGILLTIYVSFWCPMEAYTL